MKPEQQMFEEHKPSSAEPESLQEQSSELQETETLQKNSQTLEFPNIKPKDLSSPQPQEPDSVKESHKLIAQGEVKNETSKLNQKETDIVNNASEKKGKPTAPRDKLLTIVGQEKGSEDEGSDKKGIH